METLTPAVSSRQLKKELETTFPGVKFSVRLGRGSMCTDNCSVSWTDGPTTDEVEAVAGRYQGKTFDGMTDSTVYLETPIPSALGYVNVHRNFSEAALDAAEAKVLAAGWISRRSHDTRCAARSVCHGVPIDAAAEAHHLGRKEWAC